MINNRQQSGRRRGRGGQRPNNTGGGGRQDNGNRIDNRARGNAAQLLEKYKTLARDAQQGGDRVLTEYYLQFADHYFRVLSETRARYEENNPQARRNQNDFAEGEAGFEGEDGDEGDDGESHDEFRQPQQRPQQRRDGQGSDPRPQQQQRDDRNQPQREDRGQQQRDSRPQQRDDRPRRDHGDARPVQAAPQWQRDEGSERPRRRTRSGGDGPDGAARDGSTANGSVGDDDAANDAVSEDARLDMSALPPAIAPTVPSPEPLVDDSAPAPKRRGRPRKIVEDTVAAK